MLFIDANAFYWYFGRQFLGLSATQPIDVAKLNTMFDSRLICMPSSVYMEIITHFRNEPQKLKNIVTFILRKNIKIINNISKYYKWSKDELVCASMMNEKDIRSYAHTIYQQKINIETAFSVSFFEIVRLLYLEYKKNDLELNENYKNTLMYKMGTCRSEQNHKKYSDVFRTALEQGYRVNKEAKALKDAYISALNDECISINFYIQLLSNYEDQTKDLLDILEREYSDLCEKGFDGINSYEGTMKGIKFQLNTDQKYLSYAINRIAKIFKKKGFNKYQCSYIEEIMFSSWLKRAKKIEKNDIFDMFCIGVLDYKADSTPQNILVDTTTYLVSFDTTMEIFLLNAHTHSYRILNSLKLKEEQK